MPGLVLTGGLLLLYLTFWSFFVGALTREAEATPEEADSPANDAYADEDNLWAMKRPSRVRFDDNAIR